MIDLRQILYTLKQDYGAPIAFYERSPDTTNLQTGVQTIVETKYSVRKAVVLPVHVFTKLFKFDQNDFDYGGDLTIMRRMFIIDRRDLQVVPTNEFFIIYNHVRYSIEVLNEYLEKNGAYVIVGKQVMGTEVREQIEVSVQDWVYVDQTLGVIP